MVAVSPLYNYEMYFHWVTLAILWPLYIMQVLALRFTPKRRLLATRVQLIGIGILGCAIQTVRAVDPSSAFGRLNVIVQRSLYSQLGQILMYAVVLVVVATARTLCVQLNRTLPIIFVRTIWGINIISHIITFPCIIANSVYFHDGNQRGMMNVYTVVVLTFIATSLLTLGVYWVAYINLRKKIEGFLVSLVKAEETKRMTAEQLNRQLPSAHANATFTGQSVDMKALQSRPEVSGLSQGGTPAGSPPQASQIVSIRVAPATAGSSPATTNGRVHPVTSPTASPATMTTTIGANSQSDNRLKDLHSAVRKMNILTILLTILLIGTTLSQLTALLQVVKGDIVTDVVESPTQDDGSYRMNGAITSVINQLGLAVTLWYAWSSPRIWYTSTRRQNGLLFWDTIRYGPREQKETTRLGARTEQSKTAGSAHKEPAPAPGANKYAIVEEPVSPVAAAAAAAGVHIAPQTPHSPLPPPSAPQSPHASPMVVAEPPRETPTPSRAAW